jgi:hypothetical protein
VFSVCCLVSRQCHMISPIARSRDSSVLASSRQTLSPSAVFDLTRLLSLQDGAVVPLAYMILCVRFTPLVHACCSVPTTAALSARGATRDTGGWLALTRPGLAPGKKRRALLGALVVVVVVVVPRKFDNDDDNHNESKPSRDFRGEAPGHPPHLFPAIT